MTFTTTFQKHEKPDTVKTDKEPENKPVILGNGQIDSLLHFLNTETVENEVTRLTASSFSIMQKSFFR